MEIKGFADTIAWYDQNAEQYAEVQGKIADHDDVALFASKLPTEGYILDAGCAAGRDANLFTQKGLRVEGIDVSKGLIAIAKKNYPHLSFRIGNFLSLPYENETFDGIWAHQSLLHLETVEDVLTALKEFYRVLKPGGIILVLVKAKMGVEKTAVAKDAFSNHDRFFQYFTKDELRELLSKSGFKINQIEQYNEIDRNPHGRPEVDLILALGEK